MNVLEKILEEIKKERRNFESGHTWSFNKGMEYAEIIIRSHMAEVENMPGKRLIDANALDEEIANLFITITGNPKQATVIRECKESFRNMIDEQPTVYADDGWIPVSERLPEVPEGTEDVYCPEFNVTIKGASKATTLKHAPDGTWFDDSGEVYNVIAWQPLPEPYKGEE